MRFKKALLGIAAATALLFTANAQAAPVTDIWADSASFGSPILYHFDLTTGAILQKITNTHGTNEPEIRVSGGNTPSRPITPPLSTPRPLRLGRR